MGFPVLILGASGSGKTTSLRNFEPDEVGIFNVAGKRLPFKKKLPLFDNARYTQILQALKQPKLRCYIIDDSQYLMAYYMFDHAKDVGYQKFTQCALDFRNMLDFIVRGVPDDVIVYLLHHIERDDNGYIKAKTQGRMLDNQLTVEGLFSIVLLCEAEGKNHYFITQSDGKTPAKSPMGMFPDKIDNDLKAVDTAIREYYDMKPIKDSKKGAK
nr:MAG TPA_asm: AAA domain protein [Caudoviricetes sp.]